MFGFGRGDCLVGTLAAEQGKVTVVSSGFVGCDVVVGETLVAGMSMSRRFIPSCV